MESLQFQQIMCGLQHSFVVINNHIMAFGSETFGQLGISEVSQDESVKIPQPISYFKVENFFFQKYFVNERILKSLE